MKTTASQISGYLGGAPMTDPILVGSTHMLTDQLVSESTFQPLILLHHPLSQPSTTCTSFTFVYLGYGINNGQQTI